MDNQKNQTISTSELVEILRRRKLMLFMSISLALMPVLLYNLLSTPVYEATATVVIENYSQSTIVDFDLTKALSRGSIVANQIEEMKTTTLARGVYEELPESTRNLFRLPPSLSPPTDATSYMINAIRMNLSAKPIVETDFIAITYESTVPELAATIANTAAQVLQATNLKIRRQEYASLKKFIDDQIGVVSERLQTAEEALSEYKQGEKITSIDDESREFLQRMTQVEVLLDRVNADEEAAKRKLTAINKNLGEQKRDLANAVVQITDPLIVKLKERLVELNVQYSSLQMQGFADNHPKITELKREIEQTKQRLVQTTAGILEKEKLEGVIDPISQLKKNLEESILLKVETQALSAQKANLQKTLNRHLERLKELPGQELKVVRLMRDREVNNKIYVRLLEEREQARIREAAEIGNIRIVELAKKPLDPARPRKMLNMIIGLFSGAVIGLVLIFAKEFMRDVARTPEEVEQVLNLPVLASVPQVKRGFSFSMNGHRQQLRLISHKIADPMLCDAFSCLWNAMELARPGNAGVLMVTSACPAEGKSTVAANLSIIAAQHGKKTILVDGDVRSPVLHKVFGLSCSPGLVDLVRDAETVQPSSEFAENEAQLRSSVHKTRRSDDSSSEPRFQSAHEEMNSSIHDTLWQHPSLGTLQILTAGEAMAEQNDLWSTTIVKEVVSSLKQAADLIVIDSPPIIGIPDACFIARHVDSVLLCVEAAKTEKRMLQRAQKSLVSMHAKFFLGVVLNQVDPAAHYGGHQYYKYYQKQYKHTRSVT